MKIRLDKALVERGLAGSRERAQALVLAGRVLVAEQRVEKPGTPVAEDAALRVLGEDLRYVSRGGLKLERALEYWGIGLEGRACVDVGASTGGFTDCMLQHGAASVLAVDTGYGQIAHRLRVDPRVTLRERCNARLLSQGELSVVSSQLSEKADALSVVRSTLPVEDTKADSSASLRNDKQKALRNDKQGALRNDKQGAVRNDKQGAGRNDKQGAVISFLAMDVSFISATLVLPAVLRALVREGETWRGEAVVLIKPQFEAGREHVGKGGIVREQAGREIAIARVKECVAGLGGTGSGGAGVEVIESPITGMEGNHEFLLHTWFGKETA
jgi:23S rRNA (cytidine1920-2'-O)/16S rRNA (cytidine1409-2'-O)-methyltransferase